MALKTVNMKVYGEPVNLKITATCRPHMLSPALARLNFQHARVASRIQMCKLEFAMYALQTARC